MDIRAATPEDAEMLARIHHASWAETYPGLLPPQEIARYDMAFRLKQWTRILAPGSESRVVLVPEAGFAAMGRQRDEGLVEAYPEELYSLYLLRSAQGRGVGRALMLAVRSPAAFSVCVVAGNDRAERFYAAQGGVEILRRSEMIGQARIEEVVLGFAARPVVSIPAV